MECRAPETFDVSDPTKWPRWKQRFEIYLLAAGKDSAQEKIKIALLLHSLGESCLDVYNTFPKDKKTSLQDVLNNFDEYFLPKRNVTMETFKFNNITQKEDQTGDAFVTELKNQADNCSFLCQNDECKTSYSERMIKDRVVLGVHDKQVQQKLLREPDMTLQQIQDYCKSIEVTKQHIKLLADDDSTEVNVLRKIKCRRCDMEHPIRQCPAFNKTCSVCQRRGHFAKMCFWKDKNISQNQARKVEVVNEMAATAQTSKVETVSNEDHLSHEDHVFVWESKQSNKISSWYESVRIIDKNIVFKLDSGAESSILPLKYFKLVGLDQKDITPSSITIVSYGDFKSKPLGYATLKCYYKNHVKDVQFLIVDLNTEPLLGLSDCIEFNMISPINTVQNKLFHSNITLPKNINELHKMFPEVFEGLGCIPGMVDIKLKPDAKPVIQAQRRVPLALHNQLKVALNDLEQKNIISRVEYPTDWVNSLMIVEKPNGKLRLCLDPKPLNLYICREIYSIPKCD
ncbi:uncharacterized protein [Diabrotica undecimpunctata]|uniref:uncharacterized protein n=1 Tax=Diabrotica undecimpunctata TaxID=50387 RepID=UPI003B6414B3